MTELNYLIYLLAFIIGSIAGLLFSYKRHGEPFIYNKVEIVSLIIAIVGWILVINFPLFSFLIAPLITISAALFLIAFVFGMRPGYGRYETVIGIAIGLVIFLVNYLLNI